ncbi:hypothetical protein P7K49_013821 [Saguinus oedipus]|uniref:Uncharacterized protein n=1 Tax=Saguinus oedipus TaxID=9490 RepID=A0ABQ9VH09_SAGOE|nr:hypothetical protein P7K49_013821 [Saguinus oedipus]
MSSEVSNGGRHSGSGSGTRAERQVMNSEGAALGDWKDFGARHSRTRCIYVSLEEKALLHSAFEGLKSRAHHRGRKAAVFV